MIVTVAAPFRQPFSFARKGRVLEGEICPISSKSKKGEKNRDFFFAVCYNAEKEV